MNYDNNNEITTVVSALEYIDPAALEYKDDTSENCWIKISFALKDGDIPFEVFDQWCQRDPERYPGSDELLKIWDKFPGSSKDGKKVTLASVYSLASKNGWKNPNSDKYMPTFTLKTGYDPQQREADRKKKEEERKKQEEEAQIRRLRKILKAHAVQPVEIIPPSEKWNPEQDMIDYMDALFLPDDLIAINVNAALSKKNKWQPCDKGRAYRAQEITSMLTLYTVPECLGNYNRDAGVWCRINPMDGTGCDDKNVTAYRHTLIEADEIPISDQLQFISELRLPIVALVYSGNKSIHAVCRIDAQNAEEYAERVKFMISICRRYGFLIDAGNGNPSRLTRLPGVYRGDQKQFLIARHIGCSSFEEWYRLIKKGLYGITQIGMALANPAPLKPELISGVLRIGHKMMIASSSKAGKTFALLQLSIAIATGTEWLGFSCTQGSVLYLNLEIDPASAENRVNKILEKIGRKELPDNMDIMNLRGDAEPLDKLAERVIAIVEDLKEQYIAIVIDPVYKCLTGDENSNTDMAEMAKAGDRITEGTGASVLYCHHFAKGRAFEKRAADRAAGAGAFVRDVDALLTLTEYDEQTTYGDIVLQGEFITREFKTPDDIMVRFNYPLFELVTRNDYPDAAMEKKGRTQEELNDINNKIREAFKQCPRITSNTGKSGVRKKDLIQKIDELYPGLLPSDIRSKEKLIEHNELLKYVGKDGRNIVYDIMSAAL